jgi:hypothetical protein
MMPAEFVVDLFHRASTSRCTLQRSFEYTNKIALRAIDDVAALG